MVLSLKQQLVILLLAAGLSLAVGHGAFDQKWSRGDEHHYLIGALSLVQDRDLDLTANYADRDGAVFGYTEAEAHARADRAGRLHPSHPPGVIFALTGPYYLAGARGAYGAYALLFGWIFLETVKLLLFLGQPLGRSLWLTTAVMGSPLVMLNAARLFPALPAAACVTVTAARILQNRTLGPVRAFGLGLLISYLPWLHPRLSLAALVGGIGLLASQWRAKDKAAGRRAMAGTILGALTSGALFFAYQAYLFDDPWMFTRIGGGEFGPPRIFSEFYTTYRNSWGPLGLILDQEYGLIPYAPILLAVPAGAWLMFRDRAPGRLLWLSLFLSAPLIGAFYTWWTGAYAPPARFALAGVPLAALPLARVARRAPRTVLGLAALGWLISLGYAFWPADWAIGDCLGSAKPFRDGPDWLFHLHNLVPSFTRTNYFGWLAAGFWFGGMGWLTGRLVRRPWLSRLSLVAIGAVLACLVWHWPAPSRYFEADSLRAVAPGQAEALAVDRLGRVDRTRVRAVGVVNDNESRLVWDNDPTTGWSTRRRQDPADWLIYRIPDRRPLVALRIDPGPAWRTMPFGYLIKLKTRSGRAIEPKFKLVYRLPRPDRFFRPKPGLVQEIHFLDPVPTAEVELRVSRPYVFSHWTVNEITPFVAPE